MAFLIKIIFFYILYRLFRSWFRLLTVGKLKAHYSQNDTSSRQNSEDIKAGKDVIEAEFRELD